MKSARGFSMVEMMVSVAIIGGATLGIVRVTQTLNQMGGSNMDKQLMNDDATVLLSAMCSKIKNAGAGLPGSQDVTSGQTILALPDNPLVNISPNIIFLSADNAPTGLGVEDYWTSFSAGAQNGQTGIVETTYQTSNWLTIKAGTAPIVKTHFHPTQKGVTLVSLGFIFYDGQYPPQMANQSPQAVSAVRVVLGLRAAHASCTRENTVNLNDLIYGPH